jgi:hypothetical protein
MEMDRCRRRGDSLGRRLLFVDLASVTVISRDGTQAHVLRDMKNRGVEFICCGVYLRHVLRNLKTLRKTGTE